MFTSIHNYYNYELVKGEGPKGNNQCSLISCNFFIPVMFGQSDFSNNEYDAIEVDSTFLDRKVMYCAMGKRILLKPFMKHGKIDTTRYDHVYL